MELLQTFNTYFIPQIDNVRSSLFLKQDQFVEFDLGKDISLYAFFGPGGDSSYSYELTYNGKLYVILYDFEKPKALNLELVHKWTEKYVEESNPEINMPIDLDEAAFFQYSTLNDISELDYDVYRAVLDYSFNMNKELMNMHNEYNTEQYYLYEGKLYKYTNHKVQFYSAWNRQFHDCPHVGLNVLVAKGQKL